MTIGSQNGQFGERPGRSRVGFPLELLVEGSFLTLPSPLLPSFVSPSPDDDHHLLTFALSI